MRGESGLVVVEVQIGRCQFLIPGSDLRCPLFQTRLGVAALIGAAGSVKADVGKVGRDLAARPPSTDFEDAERRPVFSQNLKDLGYVPCRVAQLECVPVPSGQRAQEGIQALDIYLPARRKLK